MDGASVLEMLTPIYGSDEGGGIGARMPILTRSASSNAGTNEN